MGNSRTPTVQPGESFQQTVDLTRKECIMTDWLPTLRTKTPQEGYDLAVKLARVAVKNAEYALDHATLTAPFDALV